MGMGDWDFSWHAPKKALYPADHLSECTTNAHSCLCMLSLPVCLRPDQPCHGETGGAQVYVPLCQLPLSRNAWSLQHVAKVLLLLRPVTVTNGEVNFSLGCCWVLEEPERWFVVWLCLCLQVKQPISQCRLILPWVLLMIYTWHIHNDTVLTKIWQTDWSDCPVVA